MNAGVFAGGLYYLQNESAVASEVVANAASEYANWGGEFVDDTFRFGEQPFQITNDSPGRWGLAGGVRSK